MFVNQTLTKSGNTYQYNSDPENLFLEESMLFGIDDNEILIVVTWQKSKIDLLSKDPLLSGHIDTLFT